jgi:hypothetical protein
LRDVIGCGESRSIPSFNERRQMARTRFGSRCFVLLVGLVSPWAGGCIVTVSGPLTDVSQSAVDPALFGTWKNYDQGTYNDLTIEPASVEGGPPGLMRAVEAMRDQKGRMYAEDVLVRPYVFV